MNGYEVCNRLRKNIGTTSIPIIMFSGRGHVMDRIEGLSNGADDFLSKPFDLGELKAKIDGVLQRKLQLLSINPLTQLPGNINIEKEAKRRIKDRVKFSLSYLDIDNFKAYNDVYGYLWGDKIIKVVSEICMNVVKSFGEKYDFVGHIGGDDFVIITGAENVEMICGEITHTFDRAIPNYYNEKDREKGYIITRDRRSNLLRFPIMTLSIGIATNENLKIEHYAEIVEIAAKMKSYAKSIEERNGSIFLKNRRKA